MLNLWIALALRFRHLAVAAALAVAVWGTLAALRMPVDVLPDLDRPTVTLLTDAHGLAAEDVERRVTAPLEAALRGLPGAARVRSISGKGFSVIFAEFGWGSDVEANRREVAARVARAQEGLPRGVRPQMAPVASIMGQVQFVGVRSASGATPPAALRALADRALAPRLRAVPGVAQVTVIGGAPEETQVVADAAKLQAHGIGLAEVAAAVRGAPPGSALDAAPLDPARGLSIGDVAEVVTGPSPVRPGDAGVDGAPGVILVVFKQPGTDTVELTRRVDREVAAAPLPADARVATGLFRQAAFIERSVANVETAIRDGAVLVLLVLLLFLANVRTTVVTLTALPLSIAATAAVFHAFGLTINTMTLGGLAVAVGALVDDAVVDVENVFRRLRLNAAAPAPVHPLRVVFAASCEVRRPIFIGTLLVVVVYVPLFFLSGIEGRLFTPVGLAYIVSTLASLAVSLTVTPALCSFVLGRTFVARHRADTRLVRLLKRAAAAAIRFSLARPLPILASLASLALVSAAVLATRGTQFLPAFNEGAAQINMILPPGTGLDTSDRYGRRLEEIAAGVPGVASVARRTGRAAGDEHVDGPNVTEAVVTFDAAAGRGRAAILADLRRRLAEDLPGPAISVEQPLAHLLSHLLSGVNAQVAVKISGPDLDVLRRAAAEAEAALRPVPGVVDLFREPQILVEEVTVVPDPARCADAGLDPEAVAEAGDAALNGEEVDRPGAEPVAVRLREEDRGRLDAIRDLPIRAADGTVLLLRDVAAVGPRRVPHTLLRENGARRIVVQHNVAGRPLGDVVADVERALAPVRAALPPGYALTLGGQFEAQAAATRRIAVFSLVALAAMILILAAHFRSASLTVQALVSVPAAFVGAVAWIALAGQTLSVATLVGLISLGGIAVRNAILLLDHYLHLLHVEGEPFGPEMIVRAGTERMVPVLMTALCSGIALVPLAFSPDVPGREILHPVAVVILGGLVTVTLAEFLVTPGLFWLFGRSAGTTPAGPAATMPPKGDRDA